MATGALTETRYFQELEFKLDPSNDIQSWWEIPCISHFCSLFSSTFDLPDIDIEDLESALLCDGTDYQVGLVPELIVRLLKGCDPLKCVANDITSSNYQMFLRRYLRQQCRTYNIENHFDTDIDFQSLAVRKRLLILHALCHFRLESRDVEVILSNLEADSLRVEPLGYDCKNSGYWYFYGTRLYREDIKNNNKTKIWQVVCFTEEDWQNLTRKFKSATNIKERALFNILNENFLPKLPQLFREREKLRRKKLLQTRNSSRIRNLVEVKARQEQERANAERLEITQLEQRILLEPPRATTYKTRRRRSQSTSTASGISTYASSLRPTTNSSDFLYQRETFCLTPDDIGAESISTNAPNQVDQTSQENQEKILNSEEVYKETLVTGQFKTKKQNISTKNIPKRWESGDCSSSTTEDKENYHSISDSESESENHTMAPTTNLKLPGRQTNNSLSSLPGNIFISPSIEGKDQEPLPPRRTSSSSGRVSVKKTKNHAGTTPTPETSSTTACTGPSTTNYEMTSFKNKKKNSSKSSSEDGTKNYFYSTTSINQTNPTIQPFNNKSPPNFLSFTETDEVLQIGMHKVLVCVKNHRDAWPFMDPVEEDIAPRYYTIIRRPMDLLKMEDKLDNGEYNKFSEFRNDFKLIVNNCRLYNGQNNEYTEMVNNLQEAFDKATKKYFDNLSDDDEDSANLNYPDSKMNVFREKYFNKEISEGDEENIDTATVNKKGPSELNKHIFKKSEKKEETDDDKIEPEMFTEFSGRSNKRKRKDKDKRRKKKSKCKTVAEVLAKEEIKSRKKKEKASTSGGRKTKKKFNSKQNVENKRKLKCNTALISQKEKKASDTGDETETEEIKPSETNKQLEKISQTNQKLKKATQVVIKKKSRAKETLGMRSKTLFARYKIQTFRNEDENVKNDYVEEDNECEEQNKKERDGSRSRSVSPFKVDLHKKYAKSALNDDMKEKEEYDEADFKSVSTRSSSRESSIERPPTSLIIDVKPIFSKQTPKKIEYRKQISTSSCCDQSLTKNVKTNNNTFDVPLFLDKYDLIKQRRNRTNMEEKALNATKKEPKKMTATAAAATSLQATPLGRPRVRRESTEKLKAKTKDTEEEREKSIQEPKLEVEKIVFLEKQTKCVESQFILKDSEIQKINTNKAPKKSTILTTVAKKSAKDSEKTPAKKFIKKLVAATTTSSPIVSVSVESPRKAKLAFPSGKATNLEALELETEQTLKDINRWLEHTPRFPEFSSASNSPSRYNALLDDFDSVSTKLDAADFRRPVPIATPKIDLVPKLAESLDDLVAVAEVPNCKKDLITELIPAIGPSSVSSSCGTPPHSSISNNSGGSTSVNASSTSSLAMIPPIATCKPKEPSIIQIISNPPPPPNIKSQMQKEAKRKSLKEKLAGVSNLRRKDLIGTIDRLKPGKGKGNLIQNVNKQDEQFPLGVQQKVKEIKNALTVKTDDSVPKLSLGSVLDNDGFGLGHSHSFIDGKSEDDAEKETKEVKCESQDDSTEHKKGKPVSSLNEAPFEVKKISNSEPKADSSSATPNLSAWLKAFGVPKKAKKVDEDDSKQQQPKSNEAIVSYKSTDTNIQSLNLLKSPSSDNNHFSHPPPRTRKASTGSTISERSSFSQDPDSPRIAIDDRFGSYSGNYTSPIGASPIGASPIMVSPKPEDVGKPNSPYPLNGTIKVGFYQDTTTKSSPEKSCSPRELPSPYPQYSQHIYSSASSPNVSTTEMSGNSPYGGNSYAPSAGSEASKTPVYSSSSPIPNLYEQYKQPQSQESDYNSSMSPSTPNPHSPYQHPAQSPYQNHNSPYQQPSGANLQNQQQSSVPQSLSFQSTATDSPVVESILQNERVNSPAVSELQNQNSQYQQSANSSYQQQDTSPYTRNSESAYQPPNVFQDTSNASQQLAKVAKLTAVNPAQATQKSAPQSDVPNYDTAQQYLGFQHQQSCHQQQQQLQPQDVAMRTLYSLNKTPDWNMSQVNEQFQPPTYEHYAAAAISKDLLTQKTQDEYIQDPQSSSNSQKRHLDNENDVMNSDYKTKVAKRTDSQQLQHQQQQQQVNKQQQMYDSFLGSIGYGKHLDISPNKAFEMYNRSANMGFSKDYATSSTTKDQPLQQQRQLNQQQAVVDNSNMNKPLNMASTNSYNTQHHMVQQQQHQQQQQQNIYSKGQNTYPTNLSQASGPVAIDKPNDSVLSHLNAYKPQTYGSPTPSLLNINHHPLSTLIDESMLGLNQNTSSVSSNGMAAAGFYDKSIPPAAHMGTTSQMYQNINITPYGSHSNAISIELQQQSSNYAPSVGNSNNSTVPPSAQPLEVISLESKPVKKARSRKRTTISTSSAAQTVNDVSSKNNTAISQPQVSSTGIASSQVSNANAQQHINLHHTQMQNIQGFQLYAGLKTGVSTTSTMSSSTSASDGGAISLKTTAVAGASTVPGSAFNFGPSPAGLGLSAAGLYGDNTGYLDQFRDASNPYYMSTPTHRTGTSDAVAIDKSNNTAAASYPFLAHASSRTPAFNPFVNAPQLDANSPFYQEYMQRQDDFRARMMINQGLLGPAGPASYSQPGSYRASSLGMPKPYDINRQPWF